MKSNKSIRKISGFFFLLNLFISQLVYADFVVQDPNGAKDDYGNPIYQRVPVQESNLNRFQRSFDEADYQKLDQADRARALRTSFLSTFYKSDDPKEALTSQQIRNRNIFLNQHFYQIPDEARSSIYNELLPIVGLIGDQQVVEKFFAEAGRFSPQEKGKLMCSQLQTLEADMPRGFGQSGTKLSTNDFGYFQPVTEKFSGLVKKDLTISNYECKLNSFDEPMKVSKIFATIKESYLKKEAEKNNPSTTDASGKQLSKSDLESRAPQLKDCKEKEIRNMVSDAIESFSQKTKSGKSPGGHYMGSQQGCQVYGFVTKKDGEFQLYLNSYSKIDKPFTFKSEQDAIDKLKFLWENQKRVEKPTVQTVTPKPSKPVDDSAAGEAIFSPFSGPKPILNQYGKGTQ